MMEAKDGAMRELPRYLCTKEVWALKIAAIEGRRILPSDEGFASFDVEQAWIDKHEPKAGGYYVTYADGYASYSPAAAFEDGYVAIPLPTGEDHISQFFSYGHLKEPLRAVSRMFAHLAWRVQATLPRNAERTVALRKLLEAKDAGVRALIAK